MLLDLDEQFTASEIFDAEATVKTKGWGIIQRVLLASMAQDVETSIGTPNATADDFANAQGSYLRLKDLTGLAAAVVEQADMAREHSAK